MERNFASRVLWVSWLLHTVSKRSWALPRFYVSQVQKLQEQWILSVFLSQHAWQREGGLAFGVCARLSQILHVNSSLGKAKRDSAQRNCLHSGAALLQVEIRVALSFESLRNGEVERLRASTPILYYVRQTYLVWFLCEEDLKDTEVEIHIVKTPCERRNLWFISSIMQ